MSSSTKSLKKVEYSGKINNINDYMGNHNSVKITIPHPDETNIDESLLKTNGEKSALIQIVDADVDPSNESFLRERSVPHLGARCIEER